MFLSLTCFAELAHTPRGTRSTWRNSRGRSRRARRTRICRRALPNFRLALLGKNRKVAPRGRSRRQPHSHLPSPRTIHLRCHAYHITPKRSAASNRPDLSSQWNSRRTTQTPSAGPRRLRSNSWSLLRCGKHIPIPLRWAGGNACPVFVRPAGVKALRRILALLP